MAEDRELFQRADRTTCGLKQPANGTALDSPSRPSHVARQIGYPVLVRPSYVLGGRAMEIVYDEAALNALHGTGRGGFAGQAGPDRQVPGIGHRGGCRLPRRRPRARSSAASCSTSKKPASTPATRPASSRRTACRPPIVDEIKRQTRAMALRAERQRPDERAVRRQRGSATDGVRSIGTCLTVYVLEVNPRASRTVPFVSKATGVPLARLAVAGHGRQDAGRTGLSRGSGARRTSP